ncbi:uncharacterized protein EV154DRAFT_494695 [Mucor mucedo]|uniref:uncharacterized protein n=1 Tax=Mucor mucedo TaxID=29922 RepID=UPI00221FE095|nr:uncharacterized protein EV154DRAFT_494695 [Mucor mucedo]KAI7895717.1 hypothetical protein EV154DRAFT_494695 [Mucor mucedo]
MDSNSLNQNEQFVAMQQRLFQLEQLVAQSRAQTSTESQTSPNVNMDADDETIAALDSLRIRPSYYWTPSSFLTEVLALDSPLFPTTMLTDDERRKLIDQYPNIEQLQYQPPDTIPSAARKMNKYQSKQDMSLKRLQYLLSGVFRPLDVLGLEVSQDTNNENIQRYLHMLKDCRSLLLNVSAQINDMRNNIAFQSINPSFSSSASPSKTNFPMSPADFQAALVQQTTTSQALKTASGLRNKKRNFNQAQNGQAQQFFRSGPSSQQGGYPNNFNNNPFRPANNQANNNNNSYSNSNNHILGTEVFFVFS